MSRFAIGDIHGCYSKLQSVLCKCNFNPTTDTLYAVGDFCDRGDDSADVLQYLLSLHLNYPNSLVSCFGNHDLWLYQYLEISFDNKHMSESVWDCWYFNGGDPTTSSLKKIKVDDLRLIYEWLGNLPCQIELDDYIIRHSTIREGLIEGKDLNKLTLKRCLEEGIIDPTYDNWWWDRNIIYSSKTMYGRKAIPCNIEYTPAQKPLIVGHTPMVKGPYWDKDLNIINIDTGSFITGSKYSMKKDGEICLLNLDTLEWIKSNGEKGAFNV